MNNCLPNWPIYFALQFVFLVVGLMVWCAIRARHEQVRMPALSLFVGAAWISSLVTTIFADACLYPEAIRASICMVQPFLGYAADMAFPVLEVLVMREILVRMAGGSPSVESRILKSFWWCVPGGIAVAAWAFAFSPARGTSLPERASEFFTHTGEWIMWILFILSFVWMAHLNLRLTAGLRWILGSFVVSRVAEVFLWTVLQRREDLWNTYGISVYILLMTGLYLGVRAETAEPKSQIQVTS